MAIPKLKDLIELDVKPPTKIAGVVVKSDGKVLLTKRSEAAGKYPNFWAVPMGHVENGEKFIESAAREFKEETNMDDDSYIILNNLSSIQENYIGTNGVNYRQIYYLGMSTNDSEINYNYTDDNYEIGDIRWVSWDDAVKLIRPYYQSKININLMCPRE